MNSILKNWLGWNIKKPSPGAKITCRSLKGDGLHTWHGLIGYCMKDLGQQHYQEIMHNVSADDVSLGQDQYLKHGAGPLKERIVLEPRKIFDKAVMFYNMRMRHMTRMRMPDLIFVLHQMILTGKYYPSGEWVVPHQGSGWDQERVNACWKMMIDPTHTSIEEVEFLFSKRDNRYTSSGVPDLGLVRSFCPSAQNVGNNNRANLFGEVHFVEEPEHPLPPPSTIYDRPVVAISGPPIAPHARIFCRR